MRAFFKGHCYVINIQDISFLDSTGVTCMASQIYEITLKYVQLMLDCRLEELNFSFAVLYMQQRMEENRKNSCLEPTFVVTINCNSYEVNEFLSQHFVAEVSFDPHER